MSETEERGPGAPGPRSLPFGFRVQHWPEVGSTNAVALEAARAGEPGGLWVVADRQLAGRGRRGRDWASEPGNLYATLLLIDPAPPPVAAELSFVVALAVADAIATTAPALGPRVRLKWPNDVLVDGFKVCGILLEAEGGTPTRPLTIAAGMGVNVATHPVISGTGAFPAAHLRELGAETTVPHLFSALAHRLAEGLEVWNRGQGFALIRQRWLARAAGLGQPLTVRLPQGERHGIFETLDEAGQLVLALPDGARERIASGDVFGIGA